MKWCLDFSVLLVVAMSFAGCSHANDSKSKSSRKTAQTYKIKDGAPTGSTYFDHEDFETRQPANSLQPALPRASSPERVGVSTESADRVDGSGAIQPGPEKVHFERKESATQRDDN